MRSVKAIVGIWLLSAAAWAEPLPPRTTTSPSATAEDELSARENLRASHATPIKPVFSLPGRGERSIYLNGEATSISQAMPSFTSPYGGGASLLPDARVRTTESLTLSLKQRVTDDLTWYVMPEVGMGRGIGDGNGLAAATNGDYLGQGPLHPNPYLARYFVKYHMWFAGQAGEALSEVPYGPRPGQLLWTLGKISIPDIFDTNAYANSPRTQFFNTAFANNIGLDYAQDARGYTTGLAAQWVERSWVLRAGVFAMPTSPGSLSTTFSLSDSHSAHLELELHPRLSSTLPRPATLRLQAVRNVGPMRSYDGAADALLGLVDPGAAAAAPQRGAVRSGVGISFDVPLADDGDTGLFGRASWSDGRRESLAFNEVDRFASVGIALSGRRWGREGDTLGLAGAVSGISAAHQRFLAAGGQGLTLSDGALSYGPEHLLEAYYSLALSDSMHLTLDLQHVRNPGYNQDRGPITVLGLRLHYALPMWSFGGTYEQPTDKDEDQPVPERPVPCPPGPSAPVNQPR